MPIVPRNPRTGALEPAIATADEAEIAAHAARLREAQVSWQQAGVEHRCQVLQDWDRALQQFHKPLLAALSADTGRKLLAQVEIDRLRSRLGHWLQRAPQLLSAEAEGPSRFDGIHWRQQLVPYPLVGVIGPWNFPFLLSMMDAIPALAAGCAVLAKPSEITPRFVEPLNEAIAAVPELAAVLQLVQGAGATGAAIVSHADAVCFTGSVATGRSIAVAAAQRLIPAFLELGGKDPAVVLDNADAERAARAVLRSAAGATGQACQSIERVYVQRNIYRQFMDALLQQATTITLNTPDPGRGQLGPFISEEQAAIVSAQLEDARAKGATVHCGGMPQRHEAGGDAPGGWWCLPTVLSDIRPDMLLMQQESFGPLIPVLCFDTEDEALQHVNDSSFGLSAAVFAGTEDEAMRFARQMQAGAVSIGDAGLTVMVDDVEKDSFGDSGLGRSRSGDSGLLRFLKTRALLFQRGEVVSLQIFDESAAAPTGRSD